MTAVEWLVNVYKTQGRILPTQFQQALEMEKEQIEEVQQLRKHASLPSNDEIKKEGWNYYQENGLYFHSDIAFTKGAFFILNKINDH